MGHPAHSDLLLVAGIAMALLPEEALGQYGSVQRADGLSIMAQAPNWRHIAKGPLAQEVLGLVDSVLLLSQQQLLAHVVLKLVLR